MHVPLLLFFIALLIRPSAYAQKAEVPWEVYVRSKQAYIWSQPGWTYQDCEALPEQDPAASSKKMSYHEEKLQRERAVRRLRHEQAQASCDARKSQHLAFETDIVEAVTRLVTTPNGRVSREPVYKDEKVFRNGYEERLRYYQVRLKIKNEDGTTSDYIGWMAADQVSAPAPQEPPPPEQAKKCEECSTVGRTTTTGLPEMSTEIVMKQNYLEIAKKVDQDIVFRSDSDLALFTCLHRGDRVRGAADVQSDVDEFFQRFPEFVRTAKSAEEVFGMPSQIVRCSMLAESGLRKNSRSDAGAAGYAQIMPETMKHLIEISGKSPYKEMWAQFKQKEKGAALTDLSVRVQNNIASATGAMAMYYRWLFDNYISPESKYSTCKDCSTDPAKMRRKDVNLLGVGFNGGPGYIKPMSSKNPAEFPKSYQIPPETRGYVQKMEKCLGAGSRNTSFTESKENLDSINRKRERDIRDLQKRKDSASEEIQSKIRFLKQMQTVDANYSYERRYGDCNERSKKNWNLRPGLSTPASSPAPASVSTSASAPVSAHAPASAPASNTVSDPVSSTSHQATDNTSQ